MNCGQQSSVSSGCNNKSTTKIATSNGESNGRRRSETGHRRSSPPFRLLRSLSDEVKDPRSIWTASNVQADILRLVQVGQRGKICNASFAIAEKILRDGHRRLIGTDSAYIDLWVAGKTFYDADANVLVMALEEFATSAADSDFSKFTVSIRFTIERQGASASGNEDSVNNDGFRCAESRLLKTMSARDHLSFDRFVSPVRAKCIYGRTSAASSSSSDGTVPFQFGLDLLASNTMFAASSLDGPLPEVIPTALARGLADPAGNVFLHCQPKAGYVTVDELRRLLFILDSDPKVASLPLVGLWTSGVETVHHPFVWAACTRYVRSKCDVIEDARPFLLVVYDRRSFRPCFYECVVSPDASADLGRRRRHFQMASFIGSTSGAFSIADNRSQFRSDLIYTAPIRFPSKTTRTDDVFISNSERNGGAITPRQCLSFATSPTDSNRPFGLDSPKPSADKDGSIRSPIPEEVMRFLAAQEKKLDELRRRVDDLTREKLTSLTSSATTAAASALDEAPVASKTVSSIATMTSFVFPPLPSSNEEPEFSTVDDEAVNNAGDVEPSGECSRCPRSACTSLTFSSSSFDNSLADLKLDTMLSEPSAVDFSRQPWPSISPVLVDLPDYNPGSLMSPSFNCEVQPSCIHDDPKDSEEHFYGNILKRIATILSNQSTDYRELDGQAKFTKRPSVFDSLFLPRLNYVSLRLGENHDYDVERSAEFGMLARKYLADFRTNGESVELSLSTRRYLDKYRL